ncbi:hypothetical protein DAPPUDRAFT_113337 [Daphnia pulex]|uniref:Uncharacterized protein n=1 Tax=Daphnia pulex TaxID=6669 RepID=E9HES1_DAPPU|nr:hypothetical protein DAPPUDRAFT_113337 [Daphnia pulex]|eukprot:EFX69718.1 hypothetical protein DAPPUDRAFT_113337 [Daphnia pulex]
MAGAVVDFFEFQACDGTIYLPMPVPDTIKCSLCKIGKYSSRSRVQDSVRHMFAKHDARVAPMYTCNSCDHETSNFVIARRHEKGCGPLDESITVDGTTIMGNEVTLMYQGGPCRCPLCNWHTTDEGTVAFQSIEHHLFRVHGLTTVRRWQCRKCEANGDGYFIKTHYKTHLTETQKPYSPTVPLLPLPPNISNRELFRIINLDLSTTSCHTPTIASIRNTPNNTEGEGTSPVPYSSSPASPVSSSSSSSASNTSKDLSTQRSSPSTPNIISENSGSLDSPISSFNSPSSSKSSNNNDSSYESPASSPSQLGRLVAPGDAVCPREAFRSVWGARIEACNTVQCLDSTLTKCSAEWLKLSATPEDLTSSQKRPPPPKKPPDAHRKRSQNRQQQRIRRSQQTQNDKKSKIQRLFSLYPRRAVRKILEEESTGYSGTKETATAFLKKTYCQPAPSQEQVESARAQFDHCDWKQTTDDDIRLLSAPPSLSEIKLKLGKAANTAPGRDGLEYRHLRSLDGNGELLATIYRAVWSLGIPACWKTSRTVPIFKKGDPSDYGNFSPISLLPTMNGTFSTRRDLGYCQSEVAQDQSRQSKPVDQVVRSWKPQTMLFVVPGLMAEETEKLGHTVSVNLAVDNSGLRTDLVVTSTNPSIIIDVTVPLSSADGLDKAQARKIEKYKHLGVVLPLVVGSLGSWLPSNDKICLALGFSGRKWQILKKKMKLLAIQGTTQIIAKHLVYQTEASDPEPEEEEEEEGASPPSSSS